MIDNMEKLRCEFHEYTQFLYQALQLTPLDDEGRRVRKGRRFGAALRLSLPAERAQRSLQAYLADLPHSAEDLIAQRERVELLMEIYGELVRLTGAVSDTLLKERADLLGMGMDVLRAQRGLLQRAALPQAVRRKMLGSLQTMRDQIAEPTGAPDALPPVPELRALPAPAAPARRRRKP